MSLELWESAISLTWKNRYKSSKNQFASSEENTSDCVITQGLWRREGLSRLYNLPLQS